MFRNDFARQLIIHSFSPEKFVQATLSVFRNLYPIYLDQYPNPINFYGSLIMGSPRLAVSKPSFDAALADTNSSYEEKNTIFNTKLAKLCQSTWEKYRAEWLSCDGSEGSWDEIVQFRPAN